MKHKLKTVFFVGCALFCSFQVSKAQSSERIVVNKFIARQERQNSAVAYKNARKLLKGDLNNDGRKDLVVLYTLESFGGTNLYLQYLAVFINQNNRFLYATHRRVGGKNERHVELKSIVKGKINFDTQEYLRQDASCCPSGKGRAHFTFTNKKLKEITTRNSKRGV